MREKAELCGFYFLLLLQDFGVFASISKMAGDKREKLSKERENCVPRQNPFRVNECALDSERLREEEQGAGEGGRGRGREGGRQTPQHCPGGSGYLLVLTVGEKDAGHGGGPERGKQTSHEEEEKLQHVSTHITLLCFVRVPRDADLQWI